MAHALPLFHLYGDPPDDHAFDFIHVETVASRCLDSRLDDSRASAPQSFSILLIEAGGGEMTSRPRGCPYSAPAAILVPAAIAHGFRFEPIVTQGWVLTFTEDAGRRTCRSRAGGTVAAAGAGCTSDHSRCRRRGAGALPRYARNYLRRAASARGLSRRDARPVGVDYAVGVARLAASRARTGSVTLQPADTTVAPIAGRGRRIFP